MIIRKKHPSVNAILHNHILFIETHLESQLIGFIMPSSIHFQLFTIGSSSILSMRMSIISIVAFSPFQRSRNKNACRE